MEYSTPTGSRWCTLLVCLGLPCIIFSMYAQTLTHEFITYDDFEYVSENEWVTGGLSFDSVLWAFSHVSSSNWHPFTWVSHQIDWQLYGSWAGGHHLTSLILHAMTAVVLYLALARLTANPLPSAVVCVLWAVHPLRVESVAWVAERKDVLSGLFFALGLLAYARYVERPTRGRYLGVVTTLALGLMAKSMLVTFPFVLLLLDYWPLGRFRSRADVWTLVREKVPLFMLVAIVSAITFVAQHQGGAVKSLVSFPFSVRAENAVVSYCDYLVETIYPVGLAVYYPHPGANRPRWQFIAGVLLLSMITAGSILIRQRCPYLLVGWLWYLGMLVPVIGIVQVGNQSHADRYTYLPQIGVLIAVVWGIRSLAIATSGHRILYGLIALFAFISLGLTALSYFQIKHWKDTESLFTHALMCTTDNRIAHNNLGHFYLRKLRMDESISQFQAALNSEPDSREERSNLTTALILAGDRSLKDHKVEIAIGCFLEAKTVAPEMALHRIGRKLATAYLAMGQSKVQTGQREGAVAAFRSAIEADPDFSAAYDSLGMALRDSGQLEEAAACFRRAIELDPRDPRPRRNLETLLRECHP